METRASLTRTAEAGAGDRDALAALRWLALGDREEREGSERIAVSLRGLLTGLAGDAGGPAAQLDRARRLAANDALLLHARALAAEQWLADRAAALGVCDPAAPPFLARLATSGGDEAALALAAIAVEMRWRQALARGAADPLDLPARQFAAWCAVTGDPGGLASRYDEGQTRLALVERLARRHDDAIVLDPSECGIALPAAWLALRAGVGFGDAILAWLARRPDALVDLAVRGGSDPALARRAHGLIWPSSDPSAAAAASR